MNLIVCLDFKINYMIPTNLFRAIADFCTNVLFVPYNALRSLSFDSWWGSNFFNVILFLIVFSLLLFWLSQLQKFKKTSNE
ncbi:hypothetical protein MNBD_BACTEROID02-899 [hydrothermal vent metagenome]|uniref:Uncharacterized protein n=1 Tax=hydrothermal vent metagenome TaxID=652676 RepID=A0A3B0QT81_9ZZZZ